ncbi:MAG TPA: carbon-nitrogen hydrolase family protein [Polyangiales bacterium]|nr:carbon-nitrogen hydrolase family protein [Polyangiales bacterium]
MSDLPSITALHYQAYPGTEPWTEANLRDHIERFPEGQLGVELDNRLVATSSSLVLKLSELDVKHTFSDVCANGFIRGHDPEGDTLYGIDITVDKRVRGMRLARRLYDARKELTQQLNLRSMVFGGRMPGYHRHANKLSAEEYLAKVLRKELRDVVITAQRANGFMISGVLRDYWPQDKQSRGHAVFMEWRNPNWVPAHGKIAARTVRVAAVQYQMRSVQSFEEFATQCEFFVDTSSDFRSDFVLFPELLTNQLLSLVPADSPSASARRLSEFSERFVQFFGHMAMKYAVNVIAGTHLMVEEGKLLNVAHLFHRDGRINKQYKVHITPSEARWWGVSAGDRIEVFDTDRGRIGIAICYDVEFPEYVRALKARGAELIFVPYNTDIRSGHLRVRACSQARAIENHLYVVTAGAVGNLPHVEGADIHYAQSAILTPSDIPFARDAVAAEATPNVETMVVHDLDLVLLRRTQANGTVNIWPDRRTDLYEIHYKDRQKPV